MKPRTRVLVDGWYSWAAPSDGPNAWTPLTTVLAGLPEALRQRVLTTGALRGLVLALLSSRYGAVAMNRYDPGWRSLLLARAIFGRRRKLIVFQFFDHPPGPGRAAALWRRVDHWALRRSLALAQVLTQTELDTYPRRFDIPRGRFALVRFPARISGPDAPAPTPHGDGPVVAAGRAYCDWETLFAAAAGRGWDLNVVCSAADADRVRRLDNLHQARAQLNVELAPEATHALLSRAAISVICVTDGLVGRGHIRLAEATENGAPVIASDVASLNGYVVDGVTALLVAPGDPSALRGAVEQLLRHPDQRERLASEAFRAAAAWTAPDYLSTLKALAADLVVSETQQS